MISARGAKHRERAAPRSKAGRANRAERLARMGASSDGRARIGCSAASGGPSGGSLERRSRRESVESLAERRQFIEHGGIVARKPAPA